MLGLVGAGKTIRERRKPLMTQVEMAEKMGLSQSSISQWERDEVIPNAEQLVRIARLLSCSVEDLVVGLDPIYDKSRRTGPLESQRPRVAEMPPRAQLIAALARNTETLEAIDDVASDLFDLLAQVEGLRPGKKSHAKPKRQPKRQADREGSIR